MKRSYLKLIKYFKSDSLTQNHIRSSRDCDAFIASLIGWSDIELDNGKEWIGDAPQGYTEFNCLGRCVIPKFTGEHGQQLYEFMLNKNIIPAGSVVDYHFDSGSSTHSFTLKVEDKSLSSKAKSFSESVSRLLVEIVINKEE